MGFNPRPRAGGDDDFKMFKPGEEVSIHAPARGATRPRRTSRPLPGCFNPRPRAGGDLAALKHQFHRVVSIHAPARGATAWLLLL